MLGLSAHRLRPGGAGGGLSLSQAVLALAQPAPQLLAALPDLLPELQGGLLPAQTLLQVSTQGVVASVHVGDGNLQLRQV